MAARVIVKLACEKCNHRNYVTSKNKRKNSSRLKIKKYCRYCRTHTTHKETK